jgi:sec-independent protein translocase protein TatC
VLAMLGAFFFVKKFFEWLTRPVMRGLQDAGFKEKLTVIGVTESFWVFMKLAIVLGLLVASPLVFWELWKFVAPGLYKKEKKLALMVTCATAGCFVGGAAFAYYVLARPATYYMMTLLKVDGMEIVPELTIEHVGNFLMMTLAGTGVGFELPVVLTILGWMGIVTARGLWKFDKYALVLSVVAGGVLTPSGDPFTQVLLAGPLFILYNLSIIAVHFIEKARKKEMDDDVADPEMET